MTISMSDERRLCVGLIALGFVFVGVNLSINGLVLLLPSFVGYALIAAGLWKLAQTQSGAWSVLGQSGAVLAGALVPLSLPELFWFTLSHSTQSTAWAIIWWVYWWLLMLLRASMPLLTWNVLRRGRMRAAMLMVLPLMVVAWAVYNWLAQSLPAIALLATGSLVPLYVAAVLFWARSKGRPHQA